MGHKKTLYATAFHHEQWCYKIHTKALYHTFVKVKHLMYGIKKP